MSSRPRFAALALCAALLLAACTGIPSSGPVNEGPGVVATTEPFVPIAVGPREDDDPEGIVSGFVSASSAGFSSDFTVAREYLTDAASATWDPTARVIVFGSDALRSGFDESTNTVTYDIPVFATLDDSGRLVEGADGTREVTTFTMVKNADGQWRIASLADGTILAEAIFKRLFTPANLVFASVDESTQIPERRWLPREKVETLAARELVEGPSDWLQPAVHTGFPASSSLSLEGVVVTNGEAEVQLTPESVGTGDQRALAIEQMTLTLSALPGVSSVTLTVGGVPVTSEQSIDLKPAPLPTTDAAVFVAGRLGIFDGETVLQVPDTVGGLPEGSAGLAQSFGNPTAAWIVGGTDLVTSRAIGGGAEALTPAGGDTEPPGKTMDVVVRYEGVDLVAPSADRHSWLWTTERAGSDALVAIKPDSPHVELGVDWLRGTSVQAIAVSRDGARLAVLSRDSGKQVLEVASIVRDADGTPLSVGAPLVVGADLGLAIDLTWVDDLSIAVLGEESGEVPSDLWIAVVGGLTDPQKSVTHAIDITAREKERSLLVVDADGRVFSRSGTGWARAAQGPSEVAYSG